MSSDPVDREIEYRGRGFLNDALLRFLPSLLVISVAHFVPIYLWASWRYHGGSLFNPVGANVPYPVLSEFVGHVISDAVPTWQVISAYGLFVAGQFFLAVLLPGPNVRGLPISSQRGRRLTYKCNALYSWYITLLAVLAATYFQVVPLQIVYDNYGRLMLSAMIFADIAAVSVYFLSQGDAGAHKPLAARTRYFLMGRALNPRVLGVDLKLWSMIRVSQIPLFIVTLGAAANQYNSHGDISSPMAFMVLAHGLYVNACVKGEECIPPTWDMIEEKYGWIFIFWNFVIVPFVYSFNSLYISSVPPFEHDIVYTAFCFSLLIGSYYMWDTALSQKNRFRMQEAGTYIRRYAFPQLPFGTLEMPVFIETAAGSRLLISGWWQFARKIHYTADILMALSWGLICGLGKPLPYFYFVFFSLMLLHRAKRDAARCRDKYGSDWARYCELVPATFVPAPSRIYKYFKSR